LNTNFREHAVRKAGGDQPAIVSAIEEAPAAVAALAEPGDLVITLGAGSIGAVGPKILAALATRSGPRARPDAGREGGR